MPARLLLAPAVLSSLVVLSMDVRAATYQVGPGKTYATLDDVADRLMPGDIVEVDGNHTYAGGVILAKSGTEAQKITIRGLRVGGARPVLSGATNTIEVQGSHVTIEGFEFTAGSFRCFYHHGDDITLRDSVIHDCPRHGLLGADTDSGSLLMEYVEIYKCGGGDRDHQIYMATDERTHAGAVFRMQFCYVHDGNGGNNVKSRAERNEIYYNWIEGAFYHELELIGPDPAGGTAEALKREDSDVVGNVLWQKNTFSVMRFGGDDTGQTNGRYRFVNNTVIVQSGGGAVFRLFDGLESVEAHNNVFFGVGGAAVNLKREVEAVWSTGSAIFGGSNNWITTGSSNAPSQWTGTISGNDPRFADFGSRNLSPADGGPLVQVGNDAPASPAGHELPNPLMRPLWHPPMGSVGAVGSAQARPTSGAIDIGAFEFGAAGGSTGSGGSAGAGTGGGNAGAGTGGGSGGASTSAAAGGQGGGTASSGSTGGNTSSSASTGGAAGATGPASSGGGCGCRTSPAAGGPGVVALMLGAAGFARRRRRR